MATDLSTNVRPDRLRVARTRGAVSGVLLLVLGAWAGVVAFIGPYIDFGFTPAPDDAWHWTAARGYLEVVPGAAVFLGGLLLIVSANRLTTSLGSWLGIAGGAWLIVGPPLAGFLNIDLGSPDPRASTGVQSLESLFYFYAIGAAILMVASVALGRLSVYSLRDLRAAERRATAEPVAAPAMAPMNQPVRGGYPDASVDDSNEETYLAQPGPAVPGGAHEQLPADRGNWRRHPLRLRTHH